MKKKQLIRVLLAGQDHAGAEWHTQVLRSNQFAFRPYLAKDMNALEDFLSRRICDIVIYLADMSGPGLEKAAEIINGSGLDIPLIAICAGDNKEASITQYNDAIQAGATAVVERGNRIQLVHTIVKEINWLNDRRELRNLHLAIRLHEEEIKHLSDNSCQAIAHIRHGRFIYANRQFMSLLKVPGAGDLETRDIYHFISTDEKTVFTELLGKLAGHPFQPTLLEINLRNMDGDRLPCLLELSYSTRGNEDYIRMLVDEGKQKQIEDSFALSAGTMENITVPEELNGSPESGAETTGNPRFPAAEKNAQKETAPLDTANGLHTAEHFYQLVDQAIASAVNEHVVSTLLCVQHDNFEQLGAEYGPVETRDILIYTASLITLAISSEDITARLGNDIHGIILKNKDVNSALDVAEKIISDRCKTPPVINGRKVDLPFNIGIAAITGSQATSQEVVANAFSACQKARQSKPDGIKVFSSHSIRTSHLSGTLQLSKQIVRAINENLFALLYQPIASLKGYKGEFYEVFLQMENPDGDIVPMEVLFILAAEHSLSVIIDEWVINHALKVLGEPGSTGKDTSFFLNISAESIRSKNILAIIEKNIKTHAISANKLIIQISEGSIIGQSSSVLKFIEGLKNLGCGTALKHVGSGLNSLKIAARMPVDYIKIDTSVINNLKQDKEALGSLKAITEIAHESGKLTIADCLEDSQDLFVLLEHKVDFAQGNYIQKPAGKMEFDFSGILLR